MPQNISLMYKEISVKQSQAHTMCKPPPKILALHFLTVVSEKMQSKQFATKNRL